MDKGKCCTEALGKILKNKQNIILGNRGNNTKWENSELTWSWCKLIIIRIKEVNPFLKAFERVEVYRDPKHTPK